ncbi:alpha/beta hydrolase [Lapidilactobacillus salsurivasis]
MSIATYRMYSKALNKQTQFNLYLPSKRLERQPVLFLLHGLSDDYAAWLTLSSLARYAGQYPFAIVMPDAGRSYYTNLPNGERYWDYLTEELPLYLKTWLDFPLTRSTTFVAGLSMGGYGAFKMGLTYPERFGAAASLSGRLDIGATWADRAPYFEATFGSQDQFQASQNNLLNLMANQQVTRLPLLQYIGAEDHLLESNRTFRAFSRQYLEKLDYREQTGNHNWAFWDTYLPSTLTWLNERYQQLNS